MMSDKTSDKNTMSDKMSDKTSDKNTMSDKISDKTSDKNTMSSKTSNKTSDKNTMSSKTSNKTSDKNTKSDKLTDNAHRQVIMKYLSECNGINAFTAEKLIGRSSSTARRVLTLLVNDGVLRATGANKNRKYELNQ